MQMRSIHNHEAQIKLSQRPGVNPPPSYLRSQRRSRQWEDAFRNRTFGILREKHPPRIFTPLYVTVQRPSLNVSSCRLELCFASESSGRGHGAKLVQKPLTYSHPLQVSHVNREITANWGDGEVKGQLHRARWVKKRLSGMVWWSEQHCKAGNKRPPLV